MRIYGTGLLTIALLTTGETCLAQTAAPVDDEMIGEIIVQARKRDERLIDIPESITALSSVALERAGITSVNDLGRQIPNLQLNRRQDNEPNAVIRGIGAFGNTQGVGFYVDDVQNFTDQTMRLNDLASVEILKGPQGTLYGGSNIGGAVRYVSKRPSFTLEGDVTGEIGEFGQRSLHAAISGPLIDGKLAARISSYVAHNGGFIENVALNRRADRGNEYGARAALLFQPGDSFDALLTLRYGYLKNGGNPYIHADDVRSVKYENALSEDANNKRETIGAVLQWNYDFGGSKLSSISSYTRRDGSILWDADYSPLPLIYGYTPKNVDPTEVYTQEFRLTSASGGPFDWIVGLYGQRVEDLALNRGDLFISGIIFADPSAPPTDPVPPDVLLSPSTDSNTSRSDAAAFVTANYTFGAFKLGGGLRVSRTWYKANVRVSQGVPVGSIVNVNDTVLLPKISLSYKIGENTMIYANAAEGYEPGKVNVGNTVVPFAYKPERAWNFEVGAKGKTLSGRLEYEFAAFYIRYKDRQFETRIIDPIYGVLERIDNIGTSISKGVEGSVTWRAMPGLTFNLAGGYLNSKWDHAVADLMPLDGKTVPNAPKITGNIGVDYYRDIGSGLSADLHVDATYTSSFYWDLNNTPISGKAPSYWLVNARLAIGHESGWKLALRVENLFDQKYFTEFYPEFFGPQNSDGTCDGCHLGAPGTPRRFIVSASMKF